MALVESSMPEFYLDTSWLLQSSPTFECDDQGFPLLMYEEDSLIELTVKSG